MDKIKHIFLILGAIVLSNCSNADKLQGYWSGKIHYDNANIELIAKFDNEICQISNHYDDPYNYKISGKSVKFSPYECCEDFTLKYKVVGDSLYLFRPKVDTLVYSFKRIDINNTINDLIISSQLNISLPVGYSHKLSIFDLPNYKQYFIYLSDYSDSLLINFNGKVYPCDDNLYKHIRKDFDYGFDYYKNRVNLFIDKDVRYTDYLEFNRQLRISGLTNTRHIFGDNTSDSVNCLLRKLHSLSNDDTALVPDSLLEIINPLPPPPPSISSVKASLIKKSTILEIKADTCFFINFDRDTLSPTEIIDKIWSDEIRTVFYVHSREDISYGDYIQSIALIYKIVDTVRDRYSIENHDSKFSNLSLEIKNEVEDTYRYMIGDVTKKELSALNTTYNNVYSK